MKDTLKGLILAMAESEEVCNSLWNDIVHIDKGSDIIIATMLTELILQAKQSVIDAENIISKTTIMKAEFEKNIENLENFSKKLLTND